MGKLKCNNRLTGTSEKLINATFDCGTQYDIYKQLESIENTLDKFNINVSDLDAALKRLKNLERIFSAISTSSLYKFYVNGG